MTTISYIDSMDADEIYGWMDDNGYDTYDNELYSKWVMITSLSDKGSLNEQDEYYAKHELFYGLYATDDFYLNAYMEKNSETTHSDQVKMIIDLSVDSTGKSIFDTFVKKYRADDLVGRKKREIKLFYENKRMIHLDYMKGLQRINIVETAVEDFITLVNTERKFFERSGSGNPARNIITTKDWAEAMIEFYTLPQSQMPGINDFIKGVIDLGNLESYCDSLSYDDCASPCFKNNGVLRKTCTYDYDKLMDKECGDREFEDCRSPCNRKIKNRLTGDISCVYKK
jgi:hypothetical protein